MVEFANSNSKRQRSKSAANRSERHSPDGQLAATEIARSQGAADATLRRWLFGIIGLLAVGIIWLVVLMAQDRFGRRAVSPQSPTLRPVPARYDADRAFGYLVQLCDIGPRPSGSAGMQQQQAIITKHFQEQGATVSMQTFEIRHPEDGSNVSLGNLIASWRPEQAKRFLFCAHYDTRPFPDLDPQNPRGVFVGANDGASGTAALMELANQFHDLPADVGVDLVLFDAEEFVFEQGRDDYFLGSTFFAKKYVANPPANRYKAGVLLDMVGDKELTFYYEVNSLKYARSLARSVWNTAQRLGVRAFIPRSRHTIEDDHIPLNEIAGIPTINIIDFDYPRPGFGAPSYWHTEMDIPENCSGESLAAVVYVVHQWLLEQSSQR